MDILAVETENANPAARTAREARDASAITFSTSNNWTGDSLTRHAMAEVLTGNVGHMTGQLQARGLSVDFAGGKIRLEVRHIFGVWQFISFYNIGYVCIVDEYCTQTSNISNIKKSR